MWASGERLLAAELVRLEREMRALEAQMLDLLHEAERSGAHQVDGHRTLGAWCRATVKWSRGETTARVRASRLVAEEPSVRDRLAAGDLGVDQVRVVARARANPRCGDQLGDVLPLLLDVEPQLGFEEFRTVVERWEQLADADGAHRDAEQEHARRGLWWRPTRHSMGRARHHQPPQRRAALRAPSPVEAPPRLSHVARQAGTWHLAPVPARRQRDQPRVRGPSSTAAGSVVATRAWLAT